jgi:diadenosine tetraphosphate (Ap4A) HIT family hydrolase
MSSPHHGFALDDRLSASTVPVGDLPLCRVLLRNDSRFVWLILVPRQPGLRELADLPDTDRTQLMEETVACGEALRALGPCDKLNVGAIGNIVAQLHVHVIARTMDDVAWPATAWESGPALPCPAELLEQRVTALRRGLQID